MQAIWVDRAGGGWVDRAVPTLGPTTIVKSLDEIPAFMKGRV